MKVGYSTKAKDPTYYVQMGIRIGGKPTTKNLQKIGKHSELLKITDDPLTYAKEYVKKFEQSFEKEKVYMDYKVDFTEKLPQTNHNASKKETLNIGYLIPQKIYHDLKIHQFFKQVKKKHKMTYDCNDINRFLTHSRILMPASKLSTQSKLNNYLEQPNEIEYHQMLRFMDVLYDNYSDYLEFLYKKSFNVVKRNTNICYYDCSNYYFETESEDEDYIDSITGEVIKGLRKYGFSKDHKPNPLVQMGLFMDSDGIPISMCINHGSNNEQLSALPLEKEIVRKYKNERFIYCADAGIGSYNIRKYNDMGGRAFVISQSIKKLSAPLQQAVFNDIDYKRLSDNSPLSLKTMATFNLDILKNPDEKTKGKKAYLKTKKLYDDMIYKVIDASTSVDLGLYEEKVLKNGTIRMVKSKALLPQKIIITFSRKHMEFQRRIRNKQIKRALTILNSGNADKSKKGAHDVRRFIKSQTENDKKINYVLDEEKIKLEEQYDGFYAVATNLNADVSEIIAINKGRYQIEDCFRMMKTNFEARPVYHNNRKRIIAHFVICYTALLIFRILQKKLDDCGNHFTTNEILETLRNMEVFNKKDIYYESLYSGSKCLNALNQVFDLELDRRHYEVRSFRKKIKLISK